MRIGHVVCPAVFARAIAEGAADGAKHGTVSRQVADSVIGRVVSRLGGKLPGIPFQVVETPEGLPEAISADAAAQKVRNPRGVYHERVVYLVLSSHKSAKEVEETVFHKLHGHADLDKLYGNIITSKLDDLYTLMGEAKGMFSIAKANGVDLYSFVDGLMEDKRLSDQQRRRYMVKELLASGDCPC